MYKTFNLYSEERQDREFVEQFHELCKNIVLSGMPFDEYWENHAIPTLLQQEYDSENKLLGMLTEAGWASRLGSAVGGIGRNARNAWNDFSQGAQQAYNNDPAAGGNTPPPPSQPQGEVDPAEARRQAKLGQYQKTVDQSVQNVKNEFVKQMRDFLTAMQSSAKQDNDYIGWKIARSFYDRLMKTSQPIIDNFAMKAKYGKRDDGEFQKGREGMQQQRQQQMRQGQKMAGPSGQLPGPKPGQTYANHQMNQGVTPAHIPQAAMSPQ